MSLPCGAIHPYKPAMRDLFANTPQEDGTGAYTAADIEVLEGLEPVRRRPGMYIGGTDERALHHLAAEVLDNAMDEAVAGHASWIELELDGDGTVTVRDNGRGIPVEPHPKFPKTSTLQVILTTLHSGGKFSGKAYAMSGGLHGVGLSVVNALSDHLTVEVARDRRLWSQSFARGVPLGPVQLVGPVQNRRGTTVSFRPDAQIFGEAKLQPPRLYRLARGKSYLFRGVEIRWRCDPALLDEKGAIPAEETFHFPGGLADFLATTMADRASVTAQAFTDEAALPDNAGRVEWAIAWPEDGEDGSCASYCNTVPTPLGGSHEAGFRSGLLRGLRAFAELAGNKRAGVVSAEEVFGSGLGVLSLFLRNPQFQGQTKEKLASAEATRLVEAVVKDHFEHWLSRDPAAASALIEHLAARADERMRKRQAKDLARKSATRKLRLPGKLIDCSRSARDGTEIFLVEGDSAGGSAKAARDRDTQAVLPLRGKILNVASASADKLAGNQELADLVQALGCGTRSACRIDDLRYERVIIMTDADVDGAHIASLLLTFFFREMRPVVEAGHLHLAQPPLYRLQRGGQSAYARDDAHKDELMATDFAGPGKVEISRFKGLGEMPPSHLKQTTMDPAKRTLLRVALDVVDEGSADAGALVDRLMGRRPEHRLRFIQDNARFSEALDI